MLGTLPDLTNCFYFVTISYQQSTFDSFFAINLSEVALFILDESFFACIISLNKLRDDKASQIEIFTNKLDNSDNTTIP